MHHRSLALLITVSVALITAGCGKKKEAAKKTDPSAAAAKKGDEKKAPGAKNAADKKTDGAMRVFFIAPKEGAIVQGTPDKDGMIEVAVTMGVQGMAVKPAGQKAENTGHHHIIVDSAGIPKGQPVPKDAQHIHFGKGQTEAKVKLTAGRHKLTMQFADYAHLSYGPQMATTIEITVQINPEVPVAEPPASATEDQVPPVAATPPPSGASAAAEAAAHAAGVKMDEAKTAAEEAKKAAK